MGYGLGYTGTYSGNADTAKPSPRLRAPHFYPTSDEPTGRSAKEALRVVDGLRQDGSTWVVDADLKSSFDSIPQAGLLAAVSERSSEGRVRGLSERSLGQELCDGRARWTPTQGAGLSPLLANR